MAFKKKEVIEKKAEPIVEPVVEPVPAVMPAVEIVKPVVKVPVGYVCIRKCFFNLQLWNEGDKTPPIAKIETNHHFEPYF